MVYSRTRHHQIAISSHWISSGYNNNSFISSALILSFRYGNNNRWALGMFNLLLPSGQETAAKFYPPRSLYFPLILYAVTILILGEVGRGELCTILVRTFRPKHTFRLGEGICTLVNPWLHYKYIISILNTSINLWQIFSPLNMLPCSLRSFYVINFRR